MRAYCQIRNQHNDFIDTIIFASIIYGRVALCPFYYKNTLGNMANDMNHYNLPIFFVFFRNTTDKNG